MALVIFDTETGGLEPQHPTIQIAAIAVDADWREIDRFERKLQFDVKLADAEALAKNSYNAEAWTLSAVPAARAINDFSGFLSTHRDVEKISQRTGNPYLVCRVAGHNVTTFEMPRVEAMFKGLGKFFPVDYRALDTLQLYRWARHLKPTLPDSGKLSDIAAHFGVECGDAHDALADCRITAAIAPLILREITRP